MNDMKMKEQDSRSSRQHISSSDLKAFKQDKLEPAELESFLNHIGSCLYCSDVLAEEMDHELMKDIIKTFIETPFSNIDRYVVRNNKIKDLENA